MKTNILRLILLSLISFMLVPLILIYDDKWYYFISKITNGDIDLIAFYTWLLINTIFCAFCFIAYNHSRIYRKLLGIKYTIKNGKLVRI